MDQVAKRVVTMIVNSHLATVLLLYLFVIYPMKSQLSRVFKLMLLYHASIGSPVTNINDCGGHRMSIDLKISLSPVVLHVVINPPIKVWDSL